MIEYNSVESERILRDIFIAIDHHILKHNIRDIAYADELRKLAVAAFEKGCELGNRAGLRAASSKTKPVFSCNGTQYYPLKLSNMRTGKPVFAFFNETWTQHFERGGTLKLMDRVEYNRPEPSLIEVRFGEGSSDASSKG